MANPRSPALDPEQTLALEEAKARLEALLDELRRLLEADDG
ncbi:MAG TPA: hypothetical protein VK215_15965 [Acidimicrobiales bacterium]|nr:hypothetical protein [Acidimicrobiales bacterium]HLN43954.1 hypothetical protein [Acidimicrobiales bacterium]